MVNFWRLASAALALPLAVLAADTAKPDAVPGSYIVELNDLTTNGFLAKLAANGVDASLRRELNSPIFSGLSFTLLGDNDEEAVVKKISAIPGVQWITPVHSITAPEDRVSVARGDATTWDDSAKLYARDEKDDSEHVHKMTGVDKLRLEGYSGKGIKVAVVDSGVDYKHPALGGCFGKGCLISFGTDLVGDNLSRGPKPDADPYTNCHGHGTHVSGLVAAQSNPYGFSGVAPNVTLGHYRVLDCAGRGTTDTFIEAFIRAHADGADVITASLGEYSGWSEEPWGVVIERITAEGIACLVAVGNDGYYGAFYGSNGADGKGATGVGAINGPFAPMFLTNASYSVGDKNEVFGWTPGSDFVNGTYSLLPLSLNTSADSEACTALPASTPDLSHNVVLIHRGGCSFDIKAQNVAAAGGKMILFYNNEPGTYEFSITTKGISSVGMVSQKMGEEWIKLVAGGSSVELHMVDEASAGKLYKIEKNDIAAGYVGYYTQWGPTNELDLLPTVLAPGSFMMSTWPIKMGSYAVESGTSMATPYLAGCIALLLEANGKTPINTVNALLSNNGDPNMFHDGKKAYDWLAPVIQQGGGLVNIYDAVHATTFLNVSSISFNDTEHIGPQYFTINNTAGSPVTFSIGQVGAGTVYTLPGDGTAVPSLFEAGNYPETNKQFAELTIEPSVVVIEANKNVTVKVTANLPTGLDKARIPVYNGYLRLNGTNGDSLSIPYLGVASAMRDVVILDTKHGENFLASSVSAEPIKEGFTFNLPAPNTTANAQDTIPSFSLRLAMGTKLLRFDVRPTDESQATTEVAGIPILGSITKYPKLYQPRKVQGASTVRWNGALADGTFAPEGSYTLVVRALKIFGNPEKAEDYDVVETPKFNIRYAKAEA